MSGKDSYGYDSFLEIDQRMDNDQIKIISYQYHLYLYWFLSFTVVSHKTDSDVGIQNTSASENGKENVWREPAKPCLGLALG